MIRISTFSTVLLLATALGCSSSPDFSEDEVIAEAKTFMEAYATEISTGNAEAVAERYSRLGAYRMGNGRKEFNSYDSIREGYIRRWDGRPQFKFEFQELSFEVLSSDAILVAGKFEWSRGDSADALKMSYTGVLTRQDGELRILLEDESR